MTLCPIPLAYGATLLAQTFVAFNPAKKAWFIVAVASNQGDLIDQGFTHWLPYLQLPHSVQEMTAFNKMLDRATKRRAEWGTNRVIQ